MSNSIERNCHEHGPYYVSPDNLDAKCPLCMDRNQRNFENFLKKLPLAYQDVSLDNYVTLTKEQKGTADFCRAYVKRLRKFHEMKRPLKVGLVFFGRTGTGKTHLALGILKELAQSGISVEYITCTDLLKLDVPLNLNPEIEKLRNRLKKVQVLVIDDLVKAPLPSNRELMFNIVDTRYQNLDCTILITNVYEKGFKQHDERVISRMQERAYFLPFMWEDYRASVKKLDTKKPLDGMRQISSQEN